MSATISVDLRCSVGVMAYNEEANIAQAIDSILRQDPAGERLTEVIVVASGCEDRTVEIVTSIAAREPRIRLIEQARREGKASAVNLFIGAADAPVLALVSADVGVDDGAFDMLLRHFADPGVGMVGGRPIPVNGAGTFLGHAVHLQWQLHDRIARRSPKLGEMVAFRNVVPAFRSTPRWTSSPSRPSSHSSGTGWCTSRGPPCTTAVRRPSRTSSASGVGSMRATSGSVISSRTWRPR